MRRVVKIICNRYSDREFNCNCLADELNLPRGDIWEELYNNFGVSCFFILENKRLEKAVELLARTEFTIQEVAKLTGYSNRSFRRVFIKRIGMKPTELRENLPKNKEKQKYVVNFIKSKIWDEKANKPLFNGIRDLINLQQIVPTK